MPGQYRLVLPLGKGIPLSDVKMMRVSFSTPALLSSWSTSPIPEEWEEGKAQVCVSIHPWALLLSGPETPVWSFLEAQPVQHHTARVLEQVTWLPGTSHLSELLSH